MSRRQRHIDTIVSHLLRDDERMAIRHYVENRVSLNTFKEAKAIVARLKAKNQQNVATTQ